MIKRILSVTVLMAVMLTVLVTPAHAQTADFTYPEFDSAAFTEFSNSMLDRISSGDDYLSNRGYDETGFYLSPYWTMTVNGRAVPVYAAATYDWVLDRGVLQSFQYLFTGDGAALDITLNFCGEIADAKILPASAGIRPTVQESGVKLKITAPGAYTCLINNDSQEYAVTLFAAPDRDEDEEIEKYKELYGEENIAVYEKGVYELDSLPTEYKVIYFKKGSYILVNHKKDIRSAADAQGYTSTPFMELANAEGAVVTGFGVLDFTRLDRGERTLVNFNFCSDTLAEGLLLLNPNSWTVTAYGCTDCELKNITVFGYRTNSDGVNICGCEKMKVSDCFCRNGDDCFSVKTTNEYFESKDITFDGCTGWSCKARCFGITGEVVRDISRVTFTDCAVIYRNAVWDNDRVASLAVAVETGGAQVSDVLFENIEIYRDDGRAAYCMVYGDDIRGCSVKNVVFRNITFSSGEKIKIASARENTFFGDLCARFATLIEKAGLSEKPIFRGIIRFLSRYYEASNRVEVSFDNVRSGDILITERNIKKYAEIHGNARAELG